VREGERGGGEREREEFTVKRGKREIDEKISSSVIWSFGGHWKHFYLKS
jgi:hypothetical protein